MSKTSSSPIPVKDMVHKLQLRLLEGVQSQPHLFAARSFLSKSDYHDVVTERSIAKMCGYPLCPYLLPSDSLSKKGRYRISLKEHKVYDLVETHMFCSAKCEVDSRAYAESLQRERSLALDTAEVDKVVRLFDGLSLKGNFGNNLSIKEKEDGSVVSMEEWVGASNAIEGYVPSSRDRKGSKLKDSNHKREEKSISNEMNFMSSIITQDNGYSISKEPCGQTKKIAGPISKDSRKKMTNDGLTESADSSCNTQTVSKLSEAAECLNNDEVISEEITGAADPEAARLKWPKRTGIIESDFFNSGDSWFDSPPEEFVVDLSPFSTMFMSLFGWISSSTLAYLYGRDRSFHEEYASIDGKEYPRKIVLEDGRSSEIKQTLAGCLSRALPGLVRDLRLRTPVSTIEYGMGCLLDTMSFLDPLPSLGMKQWRVFALLFIEALSVCRIPHPMDRRFFQKECWSFFNPVGLAQLSIRLGPLGILLRGYWFNCSNDIGGFSWLFSRTPGINRGF